MKQEDGVRENFERHFFRLVLNSVSNQITSLHFTFFVYGFTNPDKHLFVSVAKPPDPPGTVPGALANRPHFGLSSDYLVCHESYSHTTPI